MIYQVSEMKFPIFEIQVRFDIFPRQSLWNLFVCSPRDCLLPESHLWSHLSHLKKLKRRRRLIRFPGCGFAQAPGMYIYVYMDWRLYMVYMDWKVYNARALGETRESSSQRKNSTVSALGGS